jgi:hypothetical protein
MLLCYVILKSPALLEDAVAVGAGQLLAALVDDGGALGATAAARAAFLGVDVVGEWREWRLLSKQ